MKYLLPLLLALILTTNTNAQSSFRFGVGYYLWGSGDLRVPSAEVEVRWDLSRWMSLGLEGNFGHYSDINASENPDRFSDAFTTMASNILLEIKVLDTDRLDLSLIAGPSFRYQHQLQLLDILEPELFSDEDGAFRSERYMLAGIHIRPEVHVHNTEKDKVNLAASTSIYNRSEIFSGVSLSYMRRI